MDILIPIALPYQSINDAFPPLLVAQRKADAAARAEKAEKEAEEDAAIPDLE